MKSFYRISDNSYPKPKLIGITKEFCLKNFLSIFNDVTVVADNCGKNTIEMLKNNNVTFYETNLGNAGSLRFVLEMAKNINDDVYLCEDDYLHLPKSLKLLEEGIKKSDYVTLYDHPDKYTRDYNLGEFCKVIKTDSSHWRTTISTCMTFATNSQKIKEDWDIWDKWTKENHPHDHQIFSALKEKKRKLIVSIPGAACHCCMEYSVRTKKVMMESWVIDMMIEKITQELSGSNLLEMANNKTGWDKLIFLDSIRNYKKSQ